MRFHHRTEGAERPVISPDNRWIAFTRANRLEKIAVGGGEPIRIADVPSDIPSFAWGPDNTIIAETSWSSGLSVVSAAGGGTLRALTTVDAAKGEAGHWYPSFLPDGKHALFTIFKSAGGLNDAQIGVVDLSTGAYHAIMPGAQHMGILMTGVLGIVGSIVGGLISRLFSKPTDGSFFHPAGIIMSIIGAILVLFLWGRFMS